MCIVCLVAKVYFVFLRVKIQDPSAWLTPFYFNLHELVIT